MRHNFDSLLDMQWNPQSDSESMFTIVIEEPRMKLELQSEI